MLCMQDEGFAHICATAAFNSATLGESAVAVLFLSSTRRVDWVAVFSSSE